MYADCVSDKLSQLLKSSVKATCLPHSAHRNVRSGWEGGKACKRKSAKVTWGMTLNGDDDNVTVNQKRAERKTYMISCITDNTWRNNFLRNHIMHPSWYLWGGKGSMYCINRDGQLLFSEAVTLTSGHESQTLAQVQFGLMGSQTSLFLQSGAKK